MKPYFEAARIAMNEDTKEEFEYPTVILWRNVQRVELGVDDDTPFKNREPKAVAFCGEGNVWLLMPYEELRDRWIAWLDANDMQLAFSRQ
jgi:hypothetical protein